MKHTQGPWKVGGKYQFATVLMNAKGESIASGGNNRTVVGEELEASLKLAAAAPELLEALQWAMSNLQEVGGEDNPKYLAARAAIAKATQL